MVCKQKTAEYAFYQKHKYLEPNWAVLLNNGEIVYQDDYSSGESAWKRLQTYCKLKGFYPVHMKLEYGDNELNILPPNADGYFFRRGILSEILCESNGDGETTPFQGNRAKTFIIGSMSNGKITTFTIKLPELLVWDSEVREPKEEYFKDKSLFEVKIKESF